METEIRPARPGDREALLGLVAEMQDAERALDPRLLPGTEMAEPYLAHLERRCRAHDGVIFVAEAGGRVIGFTGVLTRVPEEEPDQPPGTHALVSDLSVTAEYRGQGVGRTLLAAAERHARARGASELRIAVLAGNLAAERLYATAGFAPWLLILTRRLDIPPTAT